MSTPFSCFFANCWLGFWPCSLKSAYHLNYLSNYLQFSTLLPGINVEETLKVWRKLIANFWNAGSLKFACFLLAHPVYSHVLPFFSLKTVDTSSCLWHSKRCLDKLTTSQYEVVVTLIVTSRHWKVYDRRRTFPCPTDTRITSCHNPGFCHCCLSCAVSSFIGCV